MRADRHEGYRRCRCLAPLGREGRARAQQTADDAGFARVPADLPWEHYYLFQAPNPAEDDWVRARELAARAYCERTRAMV